MEKVELTLNVELGLDHGPWYWTSVTIVEDDGQSRLIAATGTVESLYVALEVGLTALRHVVAVKELDDMLS